MLVGTTTSYITLRLGVSVLLAVLTTACNKPSGPEVKKIRAGQEYAGFLKDYSNLALNPNLEGDVKTFAHPGAQKNLHRYIAIIVDPVQVYLASDADDTKLPEKTRAAVANYFRAALTKAVSDAFPVVDDPGPLVLRLRAAVIGVDAGGAVGPVDKPEHASDVIEHGANINKVAVEIELIDSETGEQIAAMVDREPLGEGAAVSSANIARHARSIAARSAFDEWASRVRIFLNREHELMGEDAKRADMSYQPYGSAPGAGRP